MRIQHAAVASIFWSTTDFAMFSVNCSAALFASVVVVLIATSGAMIGEPVAPANTGLMIPDGARTHVIALSSLSVSTRPSGKSADATDITGSAVALPPGATGFGGIWMRETGLLSVPSV